MDSVGKSLGMDGPGWPVIVTDDAGETRTWTLSEASLKIQAMHVAWLKAKLRAEKIAQLNDGIISAETCRGDLRLLDQDFACGNYSFCGPYWKECMATKDSSARLYQLLLEQYHPETKTWSLQQVENLITTNDASEFGFLEALGDILPKAMKDLGMKVAEKNPQPSSKSAPS